jgi:hypothetical protein
LYTYSPPADTVKKRIMDIDLPSDDDSPNDDSTFDGRIDLYEAYWLYVDGVRCVKPVLKQSEATKDDTDRSPLARHYNHFYEKKEDHKEKCRGLPGSLPKYKKEFEEPRGDVRKVPDENLRDLGIDLNEGDDPIWLPPEYELPSVWENDLEKMDKAELQKRVRTLRSKNEKLRDERDELQERLAKVGSSLSAYLDLKQSEENSEPASARTCENCGQTFDSKQAKQGHLIHCDSSDPMRHDDSESDTQDLEQLADELPELSKQQSADTRENTSSEEELENLNHLLRGSL